MTVEAWLQSRVPAPPPVLATSIRSAVAALASRDGADTTDVLLAAGEAVLSQLLSAEQTTRDGALELLAADALVTYAFEAAAAEPDRIRQRATLVMTALARLAAEGAR